MVDTKKIVVTVVTNLKEVHANIYNVKDHNELYNDIKKLVEREGLDLKGMVFVNQNGKVLETAAPYCTSKLNSIAKVMTGYYDTGNYN